MRLFGFGKKKDDRVDEYVIREDLDNGHDGVTERHTNGTDEDNKNMVDGNMENNGQKDIDEIDENISDYIDLDDLNYEEYEDIVNAIEENGWHLVHGAAYPITILDIMVSHKTAKANCCDIALEIVCPKGRIVTVCGLNECNIDLDDFYNRPNIYQVPHFLTLICTDVNGVALHQTTLISILKYTKDGEIETCCQEFYGDLSPIVDGKLKRKEERCYFTETIILQGGEKLMFKINNPDTDISKTELLMLSDIFEKDEE